MIFFELFVLILNEIMISAIFISFHLKDAGGKRIYIATQGNISLKGKKLIKCLLRNDQRLMTIYFKKNDENMLNMY